MLIRTIRCVVYCIFQEETILDIDLLLSLTDSLVRYLESNDINSSLRVLSEIDQYRPTDTVVVNSEQSFIDIVFSGLAKNIALHCTFTFDTEQALNSAVTSAKNKGITKITGLEITR